MTKRVKRKIKKLNCTNFNRQKRILVHYHKGVPHCYQDVTLSQNTVNVILPQHIQFIEYLNKQQTYVKIVIRHLTSCELFQTN